MEIPADTARRWIEQAQVARLATIGPDGAPVQVPTVFVRRGDEIWSPIDGKPKAGGELARVRNIRAEPRVHLLVDGYDPDWRRLWWIQIAGRASIESASSTRSAPALAALRAKYPQYRVTPLSDSSDTLIAIRILRVRTWAASSEAW